MKKVLLFAVIVLIVVFAVNWAVLDNRNEKGSPWIINLGSGMGGLNGSPDIQEYNYSLTISHQGKNAFHDVSLTLVVNDNFQNRIIERSGLLNMDVIELGPGNSVNIAGEMVIDTRDMTKEQITALGPVIKAVNITWTENGLSHTETKQFESMTRGER